MNHVVIEAGKAERRYWLDLWSYRGLLFFLSWRDILVRYKQTVFGVLWAIIRPVLNTIVFVIVFSRLAKMPSDGVPYPLLVFSAMLPWQFFASALSETSNSLIGNANMISKVYFPRLVLPLSTVAVALVDYLVTLVILFGMMAFYGVAPTWRLLVLVPLTILAMLAALGPGLILAVLNVKYRDFRYVLPFVVQFGLYLSPVGFTSNVVPEQWRLVYSINPMVGVIDGYRWAVSGKAAFIDWRGFGMSLGIVILLLVIAICYFRKTERAFADVI